MCKSGITVPIISSDRVLGHHLGENFEREYAFGDAEIRLITTIAASWEQRLKMPACCRNPALAQRNRAARC